MEQELGPKFGVAARGRGVFPGFQESSWAESMNHGFEEVKRIKAGRKANWMRCKITAK